jgi:hypothetical protein
MAFSGSAANKVWQEVNIALDSLGASGMARDAFRALKAHLAQLKGNPDLQILPFTEAQADAAGGTAILSGACKVYGVYVKKEDEGTDNMVFLYDDATNDGTAGDAFAGLDLTLAEEEALALYPNGYAAATGIVVTQYSDGIGATDGSNGGNGFVIIGAA